MNVIRVATWNAEGMFVEGTKTRRATSHDALKALRELNADIVFIPEFGDLHRLRESVSTTISSLGYETILTLYSESRIPELGFGFLSRLPVVSSRTHTLPVTGRKIIEVYCKSEEGHSLRIVGVHLDDRQESIRLEQIKTVVEVINADSETPTLLVGDFNAMHASSVFAKLTGLKAAGAIANRMPTSHVASVAKRVHEMASGTTIDYLLENTKLSNLDPSLSPTISAKQSGMEWAPALRLAKIDWIFASPGIAVRAHAIRKDVGSDHRQVVATISF